MKHAYSADRSKLYTLPTSDLMTPETMVEGERARDLTPQLTCGSAHCSAPLVFKQGPKVSAYWAHLPGMASRECVDGMTGQPGEWHNHWQHEIFAGARVEVPLSSARADAILDHLTGRFSAIEFQHSHIDAVTVRRRIESHRDAGALASVWILNSLEAHPHRGFIISRSWAVEILRAAADLGRSSMAGQPQFSVPVLLHKNGELVVVDRAEFTAGADGAAIAKISLVRDRSTGRNLRIPEEALRLWAAGSRRKTVERATPPEIMAYAARLDAVTSRLVKRPKPQRKWGAHDLAA